MVDDTAHIHGMLLSSDMRIYCFDVRLVYLQIVWHLVRKKSAESGASANCLAWPGLKAYIATEGVCAGAIAFFQPNIQLVYICFESKT